MALFVGIDQITLTKTERSAIVICAEGISQICRERIEKMKLNLSILSEYLGEYILYAHTSQELDLVISKIGISGFEDGETVYLVRNEQFRNLPHSSLTGYFAITGGTPDDSIPETCEYIVFQNSVDYDAAFLLLQDAFAYFQNWEMNVYRAMADHQKITEVMKLCAVPLQNPIALFDPSFVLVATGGEFTSDNLDHTWAQVIGKGYFPISAHEKNGENILWNSKNPFCILTEDTVKASVCLRYHGKITGYLGSTEVNEPFTSGQLSLIHAVQKILESSNYITITPLPSEQKISTLLTRLLLGYHVEDSVVEYYLRSISWNGKHKFNLMLIANVTGAEFQKEELSPTIRTLKAIFPDSLVLPLEECIAIIIKDDAMEEVCSAEHPIMTLLRKRNLVCFKSMAFSTFAYLRSAYLQCRMLLSYLQDKCQAEVYTFSSYYQDCLVSALEDSSSIKALCDPSVLAISAKKSGAEFIHSLRVFLIHGQNYSDAAKELNIHRNTLIYRIEQMEEMLGVQLHEASESKLFQLYMTCMLMETTGKEKSPQMTALTGI